jgi:tRNA nucleotidyltransferase/poly(A) polymerase
VKYLTGKALRNQLLNIERPAQVRWLIVGKQAQGKAAAYPDNEFNQSDIYEYTNSLEETLQQSVLTIDAMAMNDNGELIDPFNGQDDLQDGLLRHCNNTFSDRPENLLMVALEGARLIRWGFHVAHGTYGLMKKMVESGSYSELDAADRLEALKQALESDRPSEYFRILHRCGALAKFAPCTDALFETGAGHTSQALPELIKELDKKTVPEKLRDCFINDFDWMS